MGSRVAIVVVVVVVLLLVARRAGAASRRPAPPSANIGRFADAIATAEGYGRPGVIPTRANNPGDLNLGSPSINGVTIFETIEDGWNALYNQLERIRDGRSSNFSPSMRVIDMASKYAPLDPTAWASNVARALGVETTTQIGSLL